MSAIDDRKTSPPVLEQPRQQQEQLPNEEKTTLVATQVIGSSNLEMDSPLRTSYLSTARQIVDLKEKVDRLIDEYSKDVEAFKQMQLSPEWEGDSITHLEGFLQRREEQLEVLNQRGQLLESLAILQERLGITDDGLQEFIAGNQRAQQKVLESIANLQSQKGYLEVVRQANEASHKLSCFVDQHDRDLEEASQRMTPASVVGIMEEFLPRKKEHLELLKQQRQLFEKLIHLQQNLGIIDNNLQPVLQTNREAENETLEAIAELENLKDPLYAKYARFHALVLDSMPDIHPHFGTHYSNTREFRDTRLDLEQYIAARSQSGDFSPDITAEFEIVLQKLDRADRAEMTGSREVFSQETYEAVMQLRLGESMILRGRCERHVVVFEILRDSEGSFKFTIINTGDDEIGYWLNRGFLDSLDLPEGQTIFVKVEELSNKLFAITNLGDRGYQVQMPPEESVKQSGYPIFQMRLHYADKGWRIPREDLDLNFIEGIHPSKTRNMPVGTFLKYMENLTGKNSDPELGRMHHAQRRKSCNYKSVTSWTKGELLRIGHKIGAGSMLYRDFKQFHTQMLMDELDAIEATASPEQLKQVYRAKTDEELQLCIQRRREAAFEILQRRYSRVGSRQGADIQRIF